MNFLIFCFWKGLDKKLTEDPMFLLLPYISALFPGLSVHKHEENSLTHNKTSKLYYDTDPLASQVGVNLRTSYSIYQALQLVNSDEIVRQRIKVPNIMFMHGQEDKVCDLGAMKAFFEKVNVQNKKMVIFPGLRHELTFELNSEPVYEEIFAWIVKNEVILQ